MPVNFLITALLQRLHSYYGDDFKVQCRWDLALYCIWRTGNRAVTAACRIFLRGDGRRLVFGASRIEQNDPHFLLQCAVLRILSRAWPGPRCLAQTGWTALIACLLRSYARPNRPHSQR
jgi:hypothetical protein